MPQEGELGLRNTVTVLESMYGMEQVQGYPPDLYGDEMMRDKEFYR